MPLERQIYLLDPQKLDPETIAVAFAKTSRSPQSFRKIAAELDAKKSAEFHEKWVVGYGHASVAEHAVLHIAMEGVSRLAVETIESNRLASYTEKSTRYQKWTPEEFYSPPELQSAPAELQELYHATCQSLFEAYLEALPAVRQDVEQDLPRHEGESDGAWERRIRSEYVDVCRFLLPAASLANLGMTINARSLEHALRKMLSHPLEEVRQIGEEIRNVAVENIPTLLKYVGPVPYLIETSEVLTGLAEKVAVEKPGDWCQIVSCSVEAETHVLAAALYRFGQFDYAQAIQHVAALAPLQRQELAQTLLGKLDRFDIPLRELEYAQIIFDLIVDQGAFFELKRHRMMTQTAQPLTTHLGFAMPRRMVTAGMEALYCRSMEAAASAYDRLAEFNPHVASYMVPNGYNRRVLLGCNLRSLDHFVALRSAPNAHFSMRRIAQRMAEQARAALPVLAARLRVEPAETWQQVEQEYFSAV